MIKWVINKEVSLCRGREPESGGEHEGDEGEGSGTLRGERTADSLS
jgi:hypothetical protein